jgi:hypothetical protein
VLKVNNIPSWSIQKIKADNNHIEKIKQQWQKIFFDRAVAYLESAIVQLFNKPNTTIGF